jgi:endoglucanase
MVKTVLCILMPLLLPVLPAGLALAGCVANPLAGDRANTPPIADSRISSNSGPSTAEILQQSWTSYKQRFIQGDGRVIDRENGDRSVSEGQAYAMLRSVLANDPDTFAKTLQWAESNLRRPGNGQANQPNQLWAWKWGQSAQGKWEILDQNFASDADVDAITALILAARRWNRSDYLQLAQAKLNDLWTLSTIEAPAYSGSSQKVRYLLPGPTSAFQPQPNLAYLNPSYMAAYAFRLFAQVDKTHNWQSLVDSSYQVLDNSTRLSLVSLPSDWVALDTTTGKFQPMPANSNLSSMYSFDAYRVWWRVALDASWFGESRAKEFLQQHLGHLQMLWRSQQSIPARINLVGSPIARYEATSQYAMLYPAFQLVDPQTAEQIRQQKLLPNYKNGIWENDSAYYVQNLAWFGLFPPAEVASSLLQAH